MWVCPDHAANMDKNKEKLAFKPLKIYKYKDNIKYTWLYKQQSKLKFLKNILKYRLLGVLHSKTQLICIIGSVYMWQHKQTREVWVWWWDREVTQQKKDSKRLKSLDTAWPLATFKLFYSICNICM